jgi:peptidyl-prolyl cis-trans isomerase D
MLQALRDKTTGWFTTILLGIMALLLVASGLQGYVMNSFDSSVATIGKTKVPYTEYSDAWQRAQSMAVQSGQSVKTFDTAEERRKVLDDVVDQKLLEVASAESGMLISESSVIDQIGKQQEFQLDGKFNKMQYLAILAQNGLTEAGYLQRLQQFHAQSTIPRSIFSSAFVTDTEIDSFLKLKDQTRNFRFLSIESNELPAVAPATDADVKKYYDENSSKFMSQDMGDFEYLRIQTANATVAPGTDEVLQALYDKQAKRYKTAERRQASHILISVEGGASAPADKQKAAQTQAMALAQRARAGEDFAELAKANSKDLGSALQGGDLGMMDRGVTEAAFDTKLFQMKVGEISDPVLTAEGYHVIKLVAIDPEKVKSFVDAREELLSEYTQRESEAAFNRLAGLAVDASQADPRALTAAAKAVGLSTQRTGMVGRAGNGDPIMSNPAVLEAAFSDAVFLRGSNSPLITLAKGDQIILRAAQTKASSKRTLAEVKTDIEFVLRSERQAQALKDRAATLLKAMEGGKSLEQLATELNKTIETAQGAGRNAANRDPALSAEVFKAARPAAGKVTRFSATLGDKVALVELTGVTDGNPATADKATRDSTREQLRSERAQAEFAVMKRALKRNQDIVLHEDRLKQSE